MRPFWMELRALLDERGIEQLPLATAVGVTQAAISRYIAEDELNRRVPEPEIMERIEGELGFEPGTHFQETRCAAAAVVIRKALDGDRISVERLEALVEELRGQNDADAP